MNRPILAPAPRTDEIAIEGREPVPVALLTGFLGAGKTTLLNRILNGQHGLRVGVLVNDFGAINIDAELVSDVEENTIHLSNGCVCCEIRDDLVASLEDLLRRSSSVDYVVLEASGVSDPEGIVMTFLDKRYEGLLRLDSIVCVVDAEGIFADGDDEELTQLKVRQIGFADLVILNKTDLVGDVHVEVIRDWVGLQLNRVRIVEAQHGDVPLEILLGAGRFDPESVGLLGEARSGVDAHSHESADPRSVFDTWSYEADQAFSIEALSEMVRRDLPASVYRCKGIIFAADAPERRFALQTVGRRTQIAELDAWGDRVPRTQIVAIGRGLDGPELTESFAHCIAS